MFEYLDSSRKGKMDYTDLSTCFEIKALTKDEAEEAELSFLRNPIASTQKLNYMQEVSKAKNSGRSPTKPLFGIANSGVSSYS